MPDGRPYTPEAYAYSPVKYVGESGSIPALLLYEAGGLCYVRILIASAWPYYDGWGKWDTVGLFPEHVVTADPHEPAIADLLEELDREAAIQRQHLADRRHQANGQKPVEHRVPPPEKPTSTEVKSDPRVAPTQGSGVKSSPNPASVRGRRARANVEDAHSLKLVRSIAGLTLADFLYDR